MHLVFSSTVLGGDSPWFESKKPRVRLAFVAVHLHASGWAWGWAVSFWNFFFPHSFFTLPFILFAVIDQPERTVAYCYVGIALGQDPGPSNSVSRGWQLTPSRGHFWNLITSQHHDSTQDTLPNSS
jgi:hypothetical protein